jgi:hypothetical protein
VTRFGEFDEAARECQLHVRLTHDDESYSLQEGEPLEIVVRWQRHLLTLDGPAHARPPSAVAASITADR